MPSTPNTFNRRRSLREPLAATTALRILGDEILCRACDISEGGLGLRVTLRSLKSGDPVEVDVLIGSVVKRFRGAVVFSRPLVSGGARVGVRFVDARPGARPPSRGAGPWVPGAEEGRDAGASILSVATRPANRRARERYRTSLPVEVEPGRRTGLVEDISETGAFLWAPLLRSPGQLLRLIIRSGNGVALVAARVQWILRARGNDAFGGRTGMGVAFLKPLDHLDAILGFQTRLP